MAIKKRDYVRFVFQSLSVTILISFGVVLSILLSPITSLATRKQTKHPLGKPVKELHKDKYIQQGSSGVWDYEVPDNKLLRLFSNYEDGALGEPSGKFSSSVNGKERKLINKIRWIIRNPFNYAKRTIPLFHCKVNDCKVDYVGNKYVSDKNPSEAGWYFVKAVHDKTKKKYYCFKWVKHYPDNKVRQLLIGFKIKPEHGWTVQDLDDEDKAFTIRLPFLQSNR